MAKLTFYKPMKKISFLLLFCLYSFLGFGQDSPMAKLLNNDLKMAQKEGSATYLKQYLSSVKTESDTLYALLFRPMACPRCEAGITYVLKRLKELYPSSVTLLIATHEDVSSAKHYISQKGYKADYYLFDSTQEYNNIFSFNSNGLYGLYLLKLARNEGRLLVGGEPFDLNTVFIHELHAWTEAMPYHTYEMEEEETLSIAPPKDEKAKLEYECFKVHTDSLHPVSGVYDMPVMQDKIFMYTDELANAGYYFAVDEDGKSVDFINTICVDSVEANSFVDVPEETFISHQRQGMIYYIALGMGIVGPQKVAISYSLPKMFMERPDALAYYNMPALIVRESDSLKSSPMVPLDFDLYNEPYMYTHFNFFPLGNGQIAVGCKKLTWPIEFEKEEYCGQVNIDPFMDGFYDTECPYLAIFDLKSGKLVKRFGQLDVPQRLSRTGYYFLSPVAAYCEDEFVYGNGYMGKLYIADKENPSAVHKELRVFDIDTNHFPSLDSLSFYKLEHVKAYNSFFTKSIVAVALTKDKVSCLIRIGMPNRPLIENDAYEFVSIDRHTGRTECSVRLRKESAEERLLSFGLSKNNDTVRPYYFCKRNNNAYIKVLKTL